MISLEHENFIAKVMELASLIYILKKIFIINKKEYGLGYLDKRIRLRVGF